MQSKFKFSLDGVDATARQFSEIRRRLQELPGEIGERLRLIGSRVSNIEGVVESLADDQNPAEVGGSDLVVASSHGGTGVRNVCDTPLSACPRKTVYCRYDGVLGVDCSSADEVTDVRDADGFVSVDALRRVRWKMYLLKDDVNLKRDDAQPVVGLIAEDLDDAGLGFFCEYDMEGNPSGVDYARLSVAALRLAQEAMDEVDGLKASVRELLSSIDRMGKTPVGEPGR